jgi:hypothetical protein|tara:strand:- start:2341 stop:3228 length:888 start_codon:yes stop_codon:yes gene_type:complete
MASYDEKMQKLRESLPQGSDDPESARQTLLDIKGVTPQGRKKNMPYTPGQEGPDTLQLLKRVESREAFPESDPATGVTDMPGDLGETAFPQSDRMDAEEEVLKRFSAFINPDKKPAKVKKAAPDPPKDDGQGRSNVDVFENQPKPSTLKQRKSSPPKPPPPPPPEEEEDTDSDYTPLTVNEQGLQVNEAVADDHGEDFENVDTPGETDIYDILDQYEKDMRGDMSDDDRQKAAGLDYQNDANNSSPIYSGDGPGGKGEVYFFDDPDGGPPKGYLASPDGSFQVVTGMLFPPDYRQ